MSLEAIFTDIYRRKLWGEGSGAGSNLEVCRGYIAFLQSFFVEKDVRSVVDIGCGDWQFSKTIDWTGISYLGIDVVEEVIRQNQILYKRPGVEFRCTDGTLANEIREDCVLIKDCLQHLPDTVISPMLDAVRNAKHYVITNDWSGSSRGNEDRPSGAHREIHPGLPPFELPGAFVAPLFPAYPTKRTFVGGRG